MVKTRVQKQSSKKSPKKALWGSKKSILGGPGAFFDYDAEQFAHHAKSFLAVAPLAAEGFIEGSDFGETSAKDELWENLDDVNQRFVAMTEAAEKLVAASGGELSDAKAAFGAVAKSCKGCHDNYREKR